MSLPGAAPPIPVVAVRHLVGDIRQSCERTLFTLHSPSGAQFSFTPNPDGSFTSPPGLDATLVQVTGNPTDDYVLTDQATGERLYFAGMGGQASVSYGHLVQAVDPNGNALTFSDAYTGGIYGPPQLGSVTDTQGRQVTFTYPFQGNLEAAGILTMTDATGRAVQYGYANSQDHQLTGITDAAGGVTRYAYSGIDLTQITDPDGNVVALQYDGSHRVTSITLGAGSPVAGTYTYAYNTGSTVVTDPNNHQTTTAFDSQLRPTQATDALGHTQAWTWTADNHVQTSVDGLGNTTTYAYDATNDLTEVQLPPAPNYHGNTAGRARTRTYGPVANIPGYAVVTGTAIPSYGDSFAYGRDGNGNLTSITDQLPSQNQTQYVYNANGTVAHVVDARGQTTPSPTTSTAT